MPPLAAGLGALAGQGAAHRRRFHRRPGGAPLPLRLFVESVLAVSQQDRRSGKPTDLNISLRELLSRLYPGQRTPRPTEYWPRIMQAVHALDSDEARIPILDPDTGRHEMRRIVSVGGIPRGAGHLDDNIRIIVDRPRGSEHGPQVSQNLGKWRLKSAPGYRLLLNLAYAWHDVGRTLTPVGKGKDRRWVRSYDPSRYEKFTDNYLIDLAFPTSARAHRKLLAQDMRKAVTALVEAGEIQGVDGKLLPPKTPAGTLSFLSVQHPFSPPPQGFLIPVRRPKIASDQKVQAFRPNRGYFP